MKFFWHLHLLTVLISAAYALETEKSNPNQEQPTSLSLNLTTETTAENMRKLAKEKKPLTKSEIESLRTINPGIRLTFRYYISALGPVTDKNADEDDDEDDRLICMACFAFSLAKIEVINKDDWKPFDAKNLKSDNAFKNYYVFPRIKCEAQTGGDLSEYSDDFAEFVTMRNYAESSDDFVHLECSNPSTGTELFGSVEGANYREKVCTTYFRTAFSRNLKLALSIQKSSTKWKGSKPK